MQAAVTDIQLGLEPVVPVAEGQEQADGGQHGLGDGQDDPEKHRPLAGSVDLGRLNDAVRDRGAEEGPGDGHVEAADRQRQDQNPHGIRQVQHLGVDDVGSGHAAAEDHGDEYQDGQEVVQLMLRPAQDVAHQGGEHHAPARCRSP